MSEFRQSTHTPRYNKQCGLHASGQRRKSSRNVHFLLGNEQRFLGKGATLLHLKQEQGFSRLFTDGSAFQRGHSTRNEGPKGCAWQKQPTQASLRQLWRNKTITNNTHIHNTQSQYSLLTRNQSVTVGIIRRKGNAEGSNIGVTFWTIGLP